MATSPRAEILPPGALVPESVRVPRIVRAWQTMPPDDGVRLKFSDGGVWSISYRTLAERPDLKDLTIGNVAEVFAREPTLFHFVKRDLNRHFTP